MGKDREREGNGKEVLVGRMDGARLFAGFREHVSEGLILSTLAVRRSNWFGILKSGKSKVFMTSGTAATNTSFAPGRAAWILVFFNGFNVFFELLVSLLLGKLLNMWVTLVAVMFFWLAASAIRRLYFHPLSAYPGPPLWAASRIPYVVSLLRGKLNDDMMEMHNQYGEVVRLGPNEISFATEEAWKDIYMNRPGHKEPKKDSVWYIGKKLPHPY